MRSLLAVEQHGDFSGRELLRRWDQFVTESEIIIPALPQVVDAAGLQRVGALAQQSHTTGAEKLGNQIAETVFLGEAARGAGAVAASAQGAGFGGSVWALVPETEVEPFVARWSQAYATAFPEAASRADFFVTRAGPAATSLCGPSGFHANRV
jgi:galactokinase